MMRAEQLTPADGLQPPLTSVVEAVEKVSFLRRTPSAGSKIGNYHLLSLKPLRSLMQYSYSMI